MKNITLTQKLLKPLTASFLALIISGCSSAPEAISDGLVSADFEISQSTDISASKMTVPKKT